MALVLTLYESSNQIISGFPEYIEIETNKPSTIFYTLDGTTPDDSSDIFVDKLYMPIDGLSFSLMVIAVSGSEESDVLEVEYHTDQGGLYSRRLVDDEGINILKHGEDTVECLAVDVDGYDAMCIAIDKQDLDIKTSRVGRLGEELPDGTSKEFVQFPSIDTVTSEIFHGEVSSVNDNILFNPKAAFILIDGTTQENLDNQVVKIINRSTNSMSLVSDIYNQHIRETPIVTSNLVRSFCNPARNLYVSYYYDSRECRWIQSVQTYTPTGSVVGAVARTGPLGVFRWIESRYMSKIY